MNEDHRVKYSVQSEEIRSTPVPTVLLTAFSSAYPLNLVRIYSVSCRFLLISTKSILTTFLSCANLLTMWIDSRAESPYLKRVPVCPTVSGSMPSTSKEMWKGC